MRLKSAYKLKIGESKSSKHWRILRISSELWFKLFLIEYNRDGRFEPVKVIRCDCDGVCSYPYKY